MGGAGRRVNVPGPWPILDERIDIAKRTCRCGSCFDCKKRAADRAYYVANRARIIARASAANKINPNRRATVARYKDRNRDALRAAGRDYMAGRYVAREWKQPRVCACGAEYMPTSPQHGSCVTCQNAAKVRRNREWRRRNPHVMAIFNAQRRARRIAADERAIGQSEWRRMLGRFRHCCAYCGKSGPLTEDHVIPLSRGGRHAIGNLLPVCGPCNYSKNDRLLIEWKKRPRF